MRHRIGALLLLYLLHQQAQQLEIVAVVAAQLGLCAVLAAQLGDHRSLQVGDPGGRAGLGLQAREDRIDGRAGHRSVIGSGRRGMAGLLQQFMQHAAGGRGHASGGCARRTRIVEGILHQVRP